MTERLVEYLVCRPLWVASASGALAFYALHFAARPWELLK